MERKVNFKDVCPIINYLKSLQVEVEKANKANGWDSHNRSTTRHLLLINSEIGEATDGLRKGCADDHLTEFPAYSMEMADVLIRVLDYCSVLDVNWALVKSSQVVVREMEPEDSLMLLLTLCADVKLHDTNKSVQERQLARMALVAYVAIEHSGFKPSRLVELKMQYNAQRPDHKPENRAKSGGKKW